MRGWMIVAVLGICGMTVWAAENVAVENVGAEKPKEEAVPRLSTQAFESGELKMTEVSARSLEVMLQELNRRKDYDFSQNDGHAGPDGEYLWQWVQTVTKELLRRGYGIDDKGQLHRAGDVVPWR